MDFGAALEALRNGENVSRKGWNGKGMWVELMVPDDDRYRQYLLMYTVDGSYVPWVASQTDLLANDWAIVS